MEPRALLQTFSTPCLAFAPLRLIILDGEREPHRLTDDRRGESEVSSNEVRAPEARGQSRHGEVALSTTLLELLTVAQSKVQCDPEATQAYLSRATALLRANRQSSDGPKAASQLRGGLPRWQAQRLVTYIEQNLDRPSRSEDLTTLTGTSAGHLFRTFKATFGQTPLAYIASRRIERARQMMLTTNHPLSQIALDCGLCDQSHLT